MLQCSLRQRSPNLKFTKAANAASLSFERGGNCRVQLAAIWATANAYSNVKMAADRAVSVGMF